jgi:hypothetical protein
MFNRIKRRKKLIKDLEDRISQLVNECEIIERKCSTLRKEYDKLELEKLNQSFKLGRDHRELGNIKLLHQMFPDTAKALDAVFYSDPFDNLSNCCVYCDARKYDADHEDDCPYELVGKAWNKLSWKGRP